MAVNPDPKPGRWILPLVILGMIAFTFFFVRELPEGSTDTTVASGQPGVSDTSTTVGGGGNGDGNNTGTTQAQSNLDPDTQAYLDSIGTIDQELQALRTELVTVNDGFNNDREIEYPEAEERFEVVAGDTQALADQLDDVTPPAGLEDNHTSLLAALDAAAIAANEALEGLRSTDTGERRNTAVDAYVQAATDFDTEVTNTNNAARANA